MLELDELLRCAKERHASDLHLKAGSRPHVRVNGQLEQTVFDVLGPADTERLALAVLPRARAEEFTATGEAHFPYSLGETDGAERFRISVFRQRGSFALVIRVLPGAPSLDALGLPPIVRRLTEESRGLVLVTGPTGSGKTTTIAAMIDQINQSQAKHIVTIEDPIEVLHPDKCSIVSQREIGSDTADYASALKRVLRQDPDVIYIDGMEDPETAWAALSAASVGHLVLSTMPTLNSTETITQLIDSFPPHRQPQVRMSLAASLRGIVSQRLLERVDGKGRIPAVEVLVATGRAFEKIANPKQTDELERVIAEGEYYGMQTFDQSLFDLYKSGLIGLRDALAVASHPHDLRIALQQASL